MKTVVFLFAVSIFLPVSLQAQRAFNCPRGTEDMLNYFVMGYPNRIDNYMAPGNANPIYTSISPDLGSTNFAQQGYFVWTKSIVGYLWDVNTYDRNYIYFRTTEMNWTDPTAFKRQVTDMAMSQRCISTRWGGTPIKLTPTMSSYNFYANCQSYKTANLAYVLNTMSQPIYVQTNGNLGRVKTRFLTYQYACNSSYKGCQYMEVFSLGSGIGLYDWKYYTSKDGVNWTFNQESAINNLTPGQTTPMFACTNTYQ